MNIKQNDRRPPVIYQCVLNGRPVDLTGSTVKFLLKSFLGSLKVNTAATIVDATAGQVRYDWGATDTDMIGDFRGEFEVTYPDGKKQTFPPENYLKVQIASEIN